MLLHFNLDKKKSLILVTFNTEGGKEASSSSWTWQADMEQLSVVF